MTSQFHTSRPSSSYPATRLSVVIPALNEEDGIAEILERILSVRESLQSVGVEDLEILVVDDGSSDGTPDIVERTAGVRLIRHSTNFGYGAAIKTGFSHATGDLLAFLDADSTYPPESLADLCSAILDGRADVAIGSRRSGARSSMPAIRRLGNWIWSTLLSVIGGTLVQDPASGMRVLHRRALQRLYPLPDGLNFTPVMSTRSIHEGLSVLEVPIAYHERSGNSKLSVVRDGFRFLSTIVGTALQYNPGRLLEICGFASLAGAGVIGAGFVMARMQGVTELDPIGVLLVFVALILAVGGVSALAMGVSFNYVIALAHENPIRQANVLSTFLGPSPERHFGWAGALMGALGIAVGTGGIVLGLQGWEITRLWFWLLGSALCILTGTQLVLFGALVRVLRRLASREDEIGLDLRGSTVLGDSPDGALLPLRM